jgi:hypothetical protein
MWSAIGNAMFPESMRVYYICPEGAPGCYGKVWVLKGFPHIACHRCAGREWKTDKNNWLLLWFSRMICKANYDYLNEVYYIFSYNWLLYKNGIDLANIINHGWKKNLVALTLSMNYTKLSHLILLSTILQLITS